MVSIGRDIIRVKDGGDRRSSMAERSKMLRRLKMKHISKHPEGYHIRISCNGKMHSAWEANRHFDSEDDCFNATVKARDAILKKLKKPLSADPVPMASIKFRHSSSRSNTGHRGLYYREYSYQKRGVKIFTKVIDIRWWNESLQEWGHTTVGVRKHGGKANAIKVAKGIQKKLEGRNAIKREINL